MKGAALSPRRLAHPSAHFLHFFGASQGRANQRNPWIAVASLNIAAGGGGGVVVLGQHIRAEHLPVCLWNLGIGGSLGEASINLRPLHDLASH